MESEHKKRKSKYWKKKRGKIKRRRRNNTHLQSNAHKQHIYQNKSTNESQQRPSQTKPSKKKIKTEEKNRIREASVMPNTTVLLLVTNRHTGEGT